MNINPFPRNPSTIHVIQDRLASINHDSIMADVIRSGSLTNIRQTLQMIKDQVRDGNRVAVVDIIGEQTLLLIDQL